MPVVYRYEFAAKHEHHISTSPKFAAKKTHYLKIFDFFYFGRLIWQAASTDIRWIRYMRFTAYISVHLPMTPVLPRKDGP